MSEEENKEPESHVRVGPPNRGSMIRGARPGMGGLPGMGDPLSDDEERQWDKKEDERRALIKKRYDDVILELREALDSLMEIADIKKMEFIGRESRLDVSLEDVEGIFSSMRSLNLSLGKTRSLFDAYIHFDRSTPDLKNINNILYNFNRFMIETQQRRFFILWAQEGKYYLKSVKTKGYINNISFLVERIIGALEVAANYVVDIPKVNPSTQQRYDGLGNPQSGGLNRFDGRFGGSRFNQPNYNNSSSDGFLKRMYENSGETGKKRNLQTDPLLEELRRMNTVQKSPSRDIGDEYEEYEGA